MDIKEIRENFPITYKKVYFAHASRAPVCIPVKNAVLDYLDFFSKSGKTKIDDGLKKDRGKRLFAKLIGTEKRLISLVENTSVGLNIASNIINTSRGSNVVTVDFEYSSVIYPYLFKKPKVELRFVENKNGCVFLEDIEEMVDDKTKIVALSHVHWLSGFRYDLKSISNICQEHGAKLVIDAIQSAGAVNIDVKKFGIDVLSTSCYKWLLGLPGCGYLYVDKDLLEKSKTSFVGWRSKIVKKEKDIVIPITSEKLEIGAPCYPCLIGAEASLNMINKIGVKNIEKKILKITNILMEEIKNLGFKLLTPWEDEKRSGIINFKMKNPRKFIKELKEKDVIICGTNEAWSKSSKIFKNSTRLSPHFYNTKDEVMKFIDVLCKFIKNS